MKKIFLFILFLYCKQIHAQKSNLDTMFFREEAGVEFQWYPAGIMPLISYNYFINTHNAITSRIGINIANRHDWSGLNDFEKGNGFGGSIGYRHYFSPLNKGWIIGIKSDLWSMKINWKLKTPDEGFPLSGSSKILVLQPSLEAGYVWSLNSNKWHIGAIGGVGQEINIKTTGKEVGQGGMWIINLIAGYRF
jgi:hypothetical protein